MWTSPEGLQVVKFLLESGAKGVAVEKAAAYAAKTSNYDALDVFLKGPAAATAIPAAFKALTRHKPGQLSSDQLTIASDTVSAPATTPPGTQIQSMQQYQQIPCGASPQSYSTPRPLYEGCDPFRQMHGMDDIRQIVLNHLLENQSPNELANPSEGEPKQKKARLDYPPLESSRDTKKSLDMSVLKAKAKFHVPLQVEEFLKQQFKESDECSLGSVITLTGTAQYAQASTVRDYLGRNWPTTGPRLLKLIEELIAAGWDTSKGFSQDYERDARLSLRYFADQRLFIHVEDTQQAVVEVAQSLAWLGCVLRTSQTGQIDRSQARMCTREGATEVEFELEFEVDALPVGEESCWHDLFINPVIAYHFPIPRRGGELGLEISLPMMAALGGATRAVEFEGGLLLKGFSSAFVPLRRSGDSIQWHFIRNEDESRLSYWEADKRCPERALLDTVDQDSLSSTRAFLGWWEKTTTHLGTADANYDNLDWCPTREPHRSTNFSGGSIGFQNFAAGEMNFVVGPKDSKLHISRTGSYENIIEYASITPAVLYDSVEGRAWLVPSSAVIAHIAQKRHFRKPFCVAGKRIDIIPVDPNLNIFEAAEHMLLANGRTKLRDSDFGASEFCFKDLVLNIWSLLECLMDKDIKRKTSADTEVHMPMSKRLRGWEFMDLVVERSPLRQKETGIKKTGGNWTDLAADINAVVLFASGFEDVIRPAESSINGICHAWKQVPKDKDYLVAGVPILNSLYEQAGSRLTREHLTSTHLQWSRGPMLFEKCKNTGQFQCSCDRLQILVPKSRITAISPPGPLEEQGAVIFGQAKHSFNNSILTQRESKEKHLYSRENTPLLVRTDHQESLHCISSTDYGSPSLPSLGSGTTINTSTESESEDTYGNVYYTPETEHDSIRTLKRSREELEHTFLDDRSARRPCSDQHPEQHYIQQYPKKRSTEAAIAILGPKDLISPAHSTSRSRDTIQPHTLNRKPRLRFDENVSIGAGREIYKGGQELAGVHSHILQKTS
ncbi:hypothetical protein F5882DRAFT_339809 [Hyaloscypha sp. PMI_1271]|nr:hypothetical protein F5882DRAFT_339809 [Hyaloscypha sp. PMI_1271]